MNKRVTYNIPIWILIGMSIIPYNKVLNEVINGIFALVMSFYFIYYIKKHKENINLSISLMILTAFMITSVIISICMSSDKVLSFYNSLNVFGLILIYVYFSNNKDKEIDVKKAIIIGGFACSILSIICHIFNPYIRLEGMFNYANATSLYLGICSIIYFTSLDKISDEKYSRLYKFFIVAIISALFATESRAGIVIYIFAILFTGRNNIKQKLRINIVGIILSLFIIKKQIFLYFMFLPVVLYIIMFMVTRKKKIKNKNIKLPIIMESILLIAALLTILFTNFSRLQDIKLATPELQERLVFFQDGLKIIRNNPLGIGAGNFNKVQFFYQSANYDIKYIHNGFLQATIDFGWLFLAAFMIILIYTMYISIANKNYKSTWFVVFAMITVHSLVDFSLSFTYIGIIYVLCILFLQKKNNRKFILKRAYVGIGIYSVVIITLILISMPYQLIYNIATASEDSNISTSYKIIRGLESFPMKDNRFFVKAADISYQLQSLQGGDELLNYSSKNYEEYIKKEKMDARAYDGLATVYFKNEQGSQGEKLLLEAIKIRKFYPTLYGKLMDLYWYNFEDAVKKEDKKAAEIYAVKIDELSQVIKDSMKLKNDKSKFMNNQLEENIDFDHSQIFEKFKYLRESSIYRDWIDKN